MADASSSTNAYFFLAAVFFAGFFAAAFFTGFFAAAFFAGFFAAFFVAMSSPPPFDAKSDDRVYVV